jgi:sugar/nucleoside kinase (ribokinase family)
MVDFLVVGDVAVDNFFFIDEATLHCDKNDQNCTLDVKYGQKIPVTNHEVTIGGNAANVSVGLAKLGISSAILTTFGSDTEADFLKKALAGSGVNIDGSAVDSSRKSNQSAIIVYKGERTILTYHDDGEDLVEGIPQVPWVYLTSSSGRDSGPVFGRIVEYKALYPECQLAFNPSMSDIKNGKIAQILEIADILIVNEEELAAISPAPKVKILAVTKGKNGAVVKSDGQELSLPATGETAVETTGAGDAFSSGFLGALFYKNDLSTALSWGLKNSGRVITKIGGTAGLLTKDEII